MKTTAILTVLILMAVATPGLGGYNQMVGELEAYKPADVHTGGFDHFSPARENKEAGFPDPEFLDQVKTVMALKENWEDKARSSEEDFFYGEYNRALFNTIKGISADSDKVIKLIGEKLVLEEVEILAIFRNPAILAAKAAVRSQMESFSQVVDLDENLRQYSAFTEAVVNKAGPVRMDDDIALKFPYPGLTSLKGQIVGQEVAVADENRKITHRDVISKLRKVYWNLIYTEKSIGVTKETIAAFKRLTEVATSLYKSGKTSFQDIIKINIRLSLLKEEIVTLTGKKRNIEISILNLLNLPADTKTGPPVFRQTDKALSSLGELYGLAGNQRQELSRTRLMITKLEKMVEMAEIMIKPSFSFNFSFYDDEAILKTGTGAMQPSFPEKTMASMKNNAPVRAWSGFSTAWLGQTKQKLSALRHTLIKDERSTDGLIREAWFDLDKNRRELNLYQREILELSKSALDVSTRGYESGSVTFADAIDSYTYWLTVKLTIALKEKELASSIAEMERLTGKSF